MRTINVVKGKEVRGFGVANFTGRINIPGQGEAERLAAELQALSVSEQESIARSLHLPLARLLSWAGQSGQKPEAVIEVPPNENEGLFA